MTRSAWMLALAILGALVAPAPADAQRKELPLTVSTTFGPSEILRKTDKWEPAKLRDKVAEGEGVRALAGGRVTLLTNSGNSLRLAQFTQMFVPAPDPARPAATDAPARVTLDGGRVWVSVLPLTVTRAPLEIEAGPVTVGIRSGGTFIRANQDGGILVRVYHGLAVARATKGGWDRTLQAGTEILVPASGGAPTPQPITSDPNEANWVRWNSEQDVAGYGMPAPK
jgi:hypothetical protein